MYIIFYQFLNNKIYYIFYQSLNNKINFLDEQLTQK